MGSADADTVTIRAEGAVAHVTINRPEARNALNADVFDGLERAVERVAADAAIRVVILSGAGDRAFCAGADLDELRGLSGVEARALLGRGQAVLRRLETLPTPTIAAVRGWAVGGGFELALACSLIVAGTSARFGLPEAGLGLMPGYGGTQRLTRAVGAKAALCTMLTGEPLDAHSAWRLGLLVRPPVEDDEIGPTAAALADQVAAKSASAVGLILEAVAAAEPPHAGLCHETALAALATSSPDAGEGIAAFLEKRPPAFARAAG
jgi:enoyl-CoA hydratase